MSEEQTTETPEETTDDPQKVDSSQLDLFVEQARKQGEQIDEKFERLIAELRSSNQKKAEEPKPEKIYSASEIQPLIDNGEISAAQAAEYLAQVKVAQMRKELMEEVRKELQGQNRERTLQDRIQEYETAIPELSKEGSAERQKVIAEYKALIKEDGKPVGEETFLEALRLSFGRKPRSRSQEITGQRQRSVESSGTGSGRESGREKKSDGWPEYVSARQRAHYEKMIERGMYPDGLKDKNLLREFEYIKRKAEEAA